MLGGIAQAQTSVSPVLGSPGKLQRQIWYGLPSQLLSQLTSSPSFYLAPSSTDFVDSSYHTVGEAYGARMRGYVTAPSTGLYTFWAAGDDQVEIALSTNAFKQQSRTIIKNYLLTQHQSFDQYPSQKSAPVFLKAGEPYYLEAFQKERSTSDHFSLAWAMQGLDEAKSEQNWATPHHGAAATASSSWENLIPASQGIDGNPDTFFHTAGEPSSWWMIDFGQSRHVNRVEILNRQDCCQNRASNFRGEFLDANKQENYGLAPPASIQDGRLGWRP